MMTILDFVCYEGVQEIANSNVDQKQESKESRDVIAREARRLESAKLKRQK